MARKPISITLPEDLITRIDRIAELREETRTDVIERMIRSDIEEEEEYLDLLANPLIRATFLRLATSSSFLKKMALATREEFTPEQLAELDDARPRLTRAGERRQQERKTKSKSKSTRTKPRKEAGGDE